MARAVIIIEDIEGGDLRTELRWEPNGENLNSWAHELATQLYPAIRYQAQLIVEINKKWIEHAKEMSIAIEREEDK